MSPDGISVRYGIPAPTVRYHCRSPRGELYGAAELVMGRWAIPADVAEAWARGYVRHRHQKNQKTKNPGASERPGAAPPNDMDGRE